LLESCILGTLAVWRVTHLLNAEGGPGDVLVRLRRGLKPAALAALFECFLCLSLWVALPFALLLGASPGEKLLLWLALSGGACLLERISNVPRATTPAVYWEDEEEDHGMLRDRTK
jgi:hypothetical protein